MTREKTKSKANTLGTAAARAINSSHARPAPPTVSGRWLLSAVAGVVAGAALCVWLVLCLLFWQGSWQLLYHPSSTVAQTPSSAGIGFDSIGFAATGDGVARLSGWWIPATPDSRYRRFTVLYLHGQDGNIGDTISGLAQLHDVGANVLALDYRGYGQSKFTRPSEAGWFEDAGWAIDYLTDTRHIDPHSIIVYGKDLGANLALEIADAHHELAGVVADSPMVDATKAIFGDPRAELVPARLLVRDRYDLSAAATGLRVPVLWIEMDLPEARHGFNDEPAAYHAISGAKTLVWLNPSTNAASDRTASFLRWLDGLGAKS